MWSAIMGASPELFREVDGSRIAAVSVFFKSLATTASACALRSLCGQAVTDRFSFRRTISFEQRGDRLLLPLQRHRVVQLNIENRTMDFVPRFSIMHGCIESRAAR
jgi:hypothetical protein